MADISRNLLKNGFASGLQKGVRVLEQLILVPFFISAWGAEYYGEWLTLTIIPSILAFTELGFGTAASNMLVLRFTSDDKKGANDIARTGFWVITTLIIVGLILSITVLSILYGFNFLNSLIFDLTDAIIAVFLLMASRLINFYTQLYEGYFRAARKAFLSIHLSNFYSLAGVIAGFLVLQMGGFIVEYAVTIFFVTIIYVPLYILVARRSLSLKKSEYSPKINFDDAKIAFKTGMGFLLSPLWQSIYFQGTTFVVRVILGPGAVAIFNTVRTLSRSINQLYSIVNSSIFPELQYEIGTGNLPKARKLFRISILVTFVSAIIGMVFLYFFGLWFYKIWTSNELNPPEVMWYLFIIGIGFNAIWWTAGVIFRATNKPYKFSIAGVLAAIISVGSAYYLTLQWGLNGAALGFIILDIILAVYILPMSCKLIGIPFYSLIHDSAHDITVEFKKRFSKLL